MPEEYYSLDDVLKELRLDETELQKMVSEGEVRAYKNESKTMVFKKDDIEKIKQGSTDPTIVLPMDDVSSEDTITLSDELQGEITSDLTSDTIGLDFADMVKDTDTVELGTADMTDELIETDELLMEEESASETVESLSIDSLDTATLELTDLSAPSAPSADDTLVEAEIGELDTSEKPGKTTRKSKLPSKSRASQKVTAGPATKIQGKAVTRASAMMPVPRREKHPILNLVITITILFMIFTGIFYIDEIRHKLRDEPGFKPGGLTGTITDIFLGMFGPEVQEQHWEAITADPQNLKEEEK